MLLTAHSLLLVSFILGTHHDGADASGFSIEAEHQTGLSKLCIEDYPDGLALVLEPEKEREVLMIFKADSLWLFPTASLEKIIESSQNETNISKSNQINCAAHFEGYPSSPTFVLSPYGLDKNDSFYQNILIFKDSILLRYSIDSIDADSNQLKTSLIGKHTTATWYMDFRVNDQTKMFLFRQSRILIAINDNRVQIAGIFTVLFRAFVLNEHNLDNPVELTIREVDARFREVRYYYELESKKLLTFKSSSNSLCIDASCLNFRQFSTCDAQVGAFLDSFAYYLWQDTDFTIRLTLVGLSSIMVINFALAISFIYNQIRRVSDLS